MFWFRFEGHSQVCPPVCHDWAQVYWAFKIGIPNLSCLGDALDLQLKYRISILFLCVAQIGVGLAWLLWYHRVSRRLYALSAYSFPGPL